MALFDTIPTVMLKCKSQCYRQHHLNKWQFSDDGLLKGTIGSGHLQILLDFDAENRADRL